MKLIAISDIHGELKALERLFKKLEFTQKDKFIFLGDAIDRGPDSKGVVDFIINLSKGHKVITLKGNHESFFLESVEGNKQMYRAWLMRGGIECLNSYGCLADMERIHGDFFKSLGFIHEEENYIFVHGYVDYEKDVSEQCEEFCLWRSFYSINPHKSKKTIVCGHTRQFDGVNDKGYKICLDTGSGFKNGYITAMEVDGNKIRFIDSK